MCPFFVGDTVEKYIDIILKEAKKSLHSDDVPVGAIIVEKGKIIAKGHNTREKNKQITGHAEINAIEKAAKKKKTWHLTDCQLIVTLRPCKMCLEVIKQARISKVFYLIERDKKEKEKDIKLIKIDTVENQSEILKKFFKNKRK